MEIMLATLPSSLRTNTCRSTHTCRRTSSAPRPARDVGIHPPSVHHSLMTTSAYSWHPRTHPHPHPHARTNAAAKPCVAKPCRHHGIHSTHRTHHRWIHI